VSAREDEEGAAGRPKETETNVKALILAVAGALVITAALAQQRYYPRNQCQGSSFCYRNPEQDRVDNWNRQVQIYNSIERLRRVAPNVQPYRFAPY
jgi:hypothetical protein